MKGKENEFFPSVSFPFYREAKRKKIWVHPVENLLWIPFYASERGGGVARGHRRKGG